MSKIIKKPSPASIRRALTTLKKAELITVIREAETNDTDMVLTVQLHKDYMVKKKTIRRKKSV